VVNPNDTSGQPTWSSLFGIDPDYLTDSVMDDEQAENVRLRQALTPDYEARKRMAETLSWHHRVADDECRCGQWVREAQTWPEHQVDVMLAALRAEV
jgi:hypothetical protein